MREEARVKSLRVPDVAVGVCLRGRVRLSSHHPSKRREGRMDGDMDVDKFILVFLAHERGVVGGKGTER